MVMIAKYSLTSTRGPVLSREHVRLAYKDSTGLCKLV